MKQNVFFVSGIDTDIGKTFATGYLAKKWMDEGFSVITQKMVQTGNSYISDDILQHRKIMGIELTAEDREKLTMPVLFSYPASPHLAARLENRHISLNEIDHATAILEKRYDLVLLEGAGGLMVPLADNKLIIDYISEKRLPLILVTSGRLGSINHTLLSLEAIEKRGIVLHALLYNSFPAGEDSIIQDDTLHYLEKVLQKRFPTTALMVVPVMNRPF